MVGKTFGKLAILRATVPNISKSGYRRWLCLCACGREENKLEKDLISGKRAACRFCAAETRAVNKMLGKEFGAWKIVGRALQKHATRFWLCRCSCGKQQDVNGALLQCGLSKGCRKCSHIKMRKKTEPHDRMYSQLVKNAKARGISIEAEWNQIYDILVKQDFRCALSGVPIGIAKTNYEHYRGFTSASVDRIDSTLGYKADNIQWVHKRVNRMKQDLSQTEFISFCKLIAENNSAN